MRKLPIYLVIMAVAVIMTSCGISKSISRTPAENNPNFTINYLFEHEGIKVYRFLDGDRYVYFTNCGGGVTSIENDSIQTRTQTIR